MTDDMRFTDWFKRATGHEPYPFQIRFAHGDSLRNAVPVAGHMGRGEGLLMDVPTCLPCPAQAWRGWGCCGGDGVLEFLV
jgi:hypothetical protein